MSATAICPDPVEARYLTLEELLTRAYEDVHSRGVAQCPACAGLLHLADGAAECTSCGSRLD